MSIKAEIPTLFGKELLTRRPAIPYQQGLKEAVEITLRDLEGNPISTDGKTITIRFADGVTPTYQEAELDIENPANPLIFEPPDPVRNNAGVWVAAAGLKEGDDLKYIYNFWIYVEPSLWVNDSQAMNQTLPQIDELRSYLRDSSSFENELWEKYQYFLSDICEAIVQTVKFWNSVPPYHHTRNTRTFNYPYILKLGTEVHLMESLLEWARKNRLPFQGTVAVDDIARFDRFEQLLPMKKQELIEQILRAKAIESVFRSFRRVG